MAEFTGFSDSVFIITGDFDIGGLSPIFGSIFNGAKSFAFHIVKNGKLGKNRVLAPPLGVGPP